MTKKNINKVAKLYKQYPITEEESKSHVYNFWNEQPIINNKQHMIMSQPINNGLEKINNDLNSFDIYRVYDFSQDIIDFLNDNHTPANINIIYTKEYIEILLGLNKIAFVVKKANNICGVIASGLKNYVLSTTTKNIADIRIFCIDHRMRRLGITEKIMNFYRNALIDLEIYHSVIHSNRYIPHPITLISMYIRPIAYKKLFNNRVISSRDYSYDKELYSVADKFNEIHSFVHKFDPKIHNLNTMYQLYVEFMNKFNISQLMNVEEFSCLINSNLTYVVMDQDGNINDLFVLHSCQAKINNNKISAAMLILLTNISTSHTIGDILDYSSKMAHINRKYIFMTYDNFGLYDYLSDVDVPYIKSENYRFIYTYNWEHPQITSNQLGFI